MSEVIEYKLEFICEHFNKLLWFDNFVCNETWNIIRIKNIKNVEKAYMDKNANVKPSSNYDIAIYRKNKWILINGNKGITTTSYKENLKIPGIKIIERSYKPLLKIYKFAFEYHTLITILSRHEKCGIIEKYKIGLKEIKLRYEKLELYINGRVIAYRGDNMEMFDRIFKEIRDVYNNEYKEILNLMNKSDKQDVEPRNMHKAIAYRTWYNAKRENQRIWPNISETKTINSIEFPKNSGIYYSYPNCYVGLAIRKDINSEKYIPKIYKTDHTKIESSILYKYINNIDIEPEIKFRNRVKEYGTKILKKLENEKYMEIDYNGNIIGGNKNYEAIVYLDRIIKYEKSEYKEEGIKAQILDKNNKRIVVLNKDNKWVKSEGMRIFEIPALPYNYRQIVHDYYLLNRVKDGDYQDLTNIGIVDENGTDYITYPKITNLYLNKNLETHRLMTFKFIKNNKIKILYDT